MELAGSHCSPLPHSTTRPSVLWQLPVCSGVAHLQRAVAAGGRPRLTTFSTTTTSVLGLHFLQTKGARDSGRKTILACEVLFSFCRLS